jgi:hypothetical protein
LTGSPATAPGQRAHSARLPLAASRLSNNVFVSSSMKSGMPSVRSMMRPRISGGSALPPVSCWMSVDVSRWPRRLRVSAVTCACPVQGASNSGRKVITISANRCGTRSAARSNNSSEVESIHCASSKTSSVGCRRARPSNCLTNAASISSRFCRGSVGSGSSVGNPNRSLNSARVAGALSSDRESNAASLSRFAAGASSRKKPAGVLQLGNERVERAVATVR